MLSCHPLIEAVRKGCIADSVDINVRDDHKKTALHFACHAGSVDLVRILLEAKADVNALGFCGRSPCHEVSLFNGNIDVMHLLLEYGADIDARDEKNKTPLDWAVSRGDTTLVHFLNDFKEQMNEDKNFREISPVMDNGKEDDNNFAFLMDDLLLEDEIPDSKKNCFKRLKSLFYFLIFCIFF